MKKTIWMLKTSFKFCFFPIFITVLINSLAPLFEISINLLNRNMVNSLSDGADKGQFPYLFIWLSATYLLLYFINTAMGWLALSGWYHFSSKINGFFRKIFLYKSYKMSNEKLLDSDFLDKYSFISRNLDSVSVFINAYISIIFRLGGIILSSVGLFAVYEPLLVLYILPVSVVMIIVNVRIVNRRFNLDKKQAHTKRIADYYNDVLTGKNTAKELRIFGYRNHVLEQFEKTANQVRQEELSVELKNRQLQNLYTIFRVIVRAIPIFILLIGVQANRYDIGTFVMLFGMIEPSISSVENLSSWLINGALKQSKYLADYYDFIHPINKTELKLINSKADFENMDVPWGSFSSIDVDNVSYSYPNSNNPAIDDVSLQIKNGEIISILGYNGSGKTTLSKIISGSFIPQKGCNRINSIEIDSNNREDAYKYFGFAPQEFSRFSISIKDYVALGRADKKSDNRMIDDAYNKAGIKSLIDKLQLGENTIVGKEYDENGIDLSGGEWQRLVMGSAYMGEPEVMILDEPTASIDPLKEIEIIHNLRSNLNGKSAILISHRIGFARFADRIIMMDNGKITETGTHEELLLRKGYYYNLFNSQKQLYNQGD